MTRPLVKICGTTSAADARIAQDAGADYIGVIALHPPSPRNVDFAIIGVIRMVIQRPWALLTVNQTAKTIRRLNDRFKPDAIQLHGDESAAVVRELANDGLVVWKAVHGDARQLLEAAKLYTDAGAQAIVVDARESSATGPIYGGTGQLSNWKGARGLVKAGHRVVLAGGLNAHNAERAIETVQPWMVDVVSGVEARKGIKDAQKVRDFVWATRKVG